MPGLQELVALLSGAAGGYVDYRQMRQEQNQLKQEQERKQREYEEKRAFDLAKFDLDRVKTLSEIDTARRTRDAAERAAAAGSVNMLPNTRDLSYDYTALDNAKRGGVSLDTKSNPLIATGPTKLTLPGETYGFASAPPVPGQAPAPLERKGPMSITMEGFKLPERAQTITRAMTAEEAEKQAKAERLNKFASDYKQAGNEDIAKAIQLYGEGLSLPANLLQSPEAREKWQRFLTDEDIRQAEATARANAKFRPAAPDGLTVRDRVDFQQGLSRIASRPEVKDVQDMARYVSGLEEAMRESNTGKNNVAVDQTLINAFNKLLDPQSVVRESEYARTASDLSVLNRLRGKLGADGKLALGGAGLTQEDREAIARMARNFAAAADVKARTAIDEVASVYDQIPTATGGTIGEMLRQGYAKTLSPQETGNVMMKAPDGRMLSVPRSDVQEMIKRGATLVGGK